MELEQTIASKWYCVDITLWNNYVQFSIILDHYRRFNEMKYAILRNNENWNILGKFLCIEQTHVYLYIANVWRQRVFL